MKRKKAAGERWLIRWAPWVAGAIVALGAVIGILAISDPDMFATDAATLSSSTELDRAQFNDDRLTHGRDAGLKYAAGLAAIAAGVVSLAKFQQARDDARRADRAQFNQRYLDAVKLLTSGDTVHQRLAGLYALEQLMADSQIHIGPVKEVLAAYIRTDSKRSEWVEEIGEEIEYMDPVCAACLQVLGRTYISTHTFLNSVDLKHSRIEGDFRSMSLPGADLTGARAIRADFSRGELTKTVWSRSDLTGSKFVDASLVGGVFQGTKLVRCDLTGADLTAADLHDADLRRATIDGTLMPDGWEGVVAYRPDGTQPARDTSEGG